MQNQGTVAAAALHFAKSLVLKTVLKIVLATTPTVSHGPSAHL
jgi:hypothetical protein